MCSMIDCNTIFGNTNIDTMNNKTDLDCKMSKYIEEIDYIEKRIKIGKGLINIFHINIRSLNCNYRGLVNLIGERPEIDIIALTEIWNVNITTFHKLFEQFKFEYLLPTKKVGGVGIYISNKIKYEIISKNRSCYYEGIWLEIEMGCMKVIFSCIYRHPGMRIDEFVHDVEQRIKEVIKNNSDKIYIYTGDINVCIAEDKSNYNAKYKDMMNMYDMREIVDIPTRVYKDAATILDHVYIRHGSGVNIKSYVIKTDLTDHYANSIHIYNRHGKSYKVNKQVMSRRIRIYDKKSVKNYREEVIAKLNNQYNIEDDIEEKIRKVNNIIMQSVIEKLPMRTIYKRKQNNLPWFNEVVKEAWKKKNYCYKKYNKNRKEKKEYMKYKLYQNKFKDILKEEEIKYYKTKMDECRNNPRKVWKFVNQFRNDSQYKGKDESIEDDKNDPNYFNDYFIKCAGYREDSDAKRLGNHSVKECTNVKTSINGRNYNSFYLEYTDCNEVFELIKRLPRSASNDLYNIKQFKIIMDIITPYITDIINSSIDCCRFPEQLKVAKVIPIYKGDGDRREPRNYRPIALLPIMAKIYEKILNMRIVKYLEKHDIINSNQYGFRKGCSTIHAILHFTNEIMKALDRKERAIGIYIDIMKAFDSVDHDKLIDKLESYGFRGSIKQLMKSYLAERYQSVYMSGRNSEMKKISRGIIQGSVLGSTLFIIFINDIVNYNKSGHVMSLYADDMSVLITDKSIEDVYKKTNEYVKELYEWMGNNDMRINVSKTKYMLFSKQKDSKYNCNNDGNKIILDTNEAEKVSMVRFLGLIIDDNVKYNKHIEQVVTNIRMAIPTLYRIRDCVDKETKKMIYHGLINSHINYGLLAYGTAAQNKLQEIQVMANRAFRIFFRLKYDISLKNAREEYNMRDVNQMYEYYIHILAHSIYYGNAPKAIREQVRFKKRDTGRVSKFGVKPILYQINSNMGRRTLTFMTNKLVGEQGMKNIEKYPNINMYKKINFKVIADRKVP